MDGGLTAGLALRHGRRVPCVMTADLQDPPELIPEFLRKWEEGYENVYMVVSERQGTGPLRTFNSQGLLLAGGQAHRRRDPAQRERLPARRPRRLRDDQPMQERNRFVRGLFAWAGYKSIGIPHERPPRFGGESKAHSFKVLDLAFKGIFAHSYVPLRLITVTGSRRLRALRRRADRVLASSSSSPVCPSPASAR